MKRVTRDLMTALMVWAIVGCCNSTRRAQKAAELDKS
jgi:hypothetical protein